MGHWQTVSSMEDDCDKESTLKVGELLIYRSGTRALRFNGHYVGAPVHLFIYLFI
jgi:hypothetical protein